MFIDKKYSTQMKCRLMLFIRYMDKVDEFNYNLYKSIEIHIYETCIFETCIFTPYREDYLNVSTHSPSFCFSGAGGNVSTHSPNFCFLGGGVKIFYEGGGAIRHVRVLWSRARCTLKQPPSSPPSTIIDSFTTSIPQNTTIPHIT